MSKKVLITGVSGSGKSTLEKIFDRKGYQTSDIDRGFAEWRNKKTGAVEARKPESAEWLAGVEWCLRANELKDKLKSVEDQPVLIFGSTNDLHEYTSLFDTIFLLEYPDSETVVSRLELRPETDYGKMPHERDSILSYYREYQDKMKQLGAKAIDCTLPINQVVEVIEAEI